MNSSRGGRTEVQIIHSVRVHLFILSGKKVARITGVSYQYTVLVIVLRSSSLVWDRSQIFSESYFSENLNDEEMIHSLINSEQHWKKSNTNRQLAKRSQYTQALQQ